MKEIIKFVLKIETITEINNHAWYNVKTTEHDIGSLKIYQFEESISLRKRKKIKLEKKLANIFVSENGFMEGLLEPKAPKAVSLLYFLGFDMTKNKPLFEEQNNLIQITKNFGSKKGLSQCVKRM